MPIKQTKRVRRKKALIKRDGSGCAKCGAPDRRPRVIRNRRGERESKAFLTIDHITPTRNGGTDDIGNLRLLCEECHKRSDNMHKGGYHPDTGELSRDYIQNSRRYRRLRETQIRKGELHGPQAQNASTN